MCLALGALFIAPAMVEAQVPLDADPGNSVRTREDLERLVSFYEEVLASPAYSDRTKREAELGMERVRDRLVNGDFRVGDRITLSVEGEPQLPDTAVVENGPKITLALFGDIPLNGVLRPEIEPHLTEFLGRFINDPEVRAEALMRLSIQGQVGDPGFYVVPADMLVSDALMTAGGPAPEADLEALRIERASATLIGGERLQEAMREGWTLDQLNLQAGDQLVLPQRTGGFFSGVGRIMLGVIPAVLVGLLVSG